MWMLNVILLVSLGALLWAAVKVARHVRQQRKAAAAGIEKHDGMRGMR
jgi:multisubunit Na+/H+ antiporter MnhE subunit